MEALRLQREQAAALTAEDFDDSRMFPHEDAAADSSGDDEGGVDDVADLPMVTLNTFLFHTIHGESMILVRTYAMACQGAVATILKQ